MLALDPDPRRPFAAKMTPTRRTVAEIRAEDARFQRRLALSTLVLAVIAIAFALAFLARLAEAEVAGRLEASPAQLGVMEPERLMIGRALEQDV